MTTTDTTVSGLDFATVAIEAGGRHKGFVLARLRGWSNKQIEEACGNKEGTVAFAITQLRKKHGIVGTKDNGWGLTDLAAALGLSA